MEEKQEGPRPQGFLGAWRAKRQMERARLLEFHAAQLEHCITVEKVWEGQQAGLGGAYGDKLVDRAYDRLKAAHAKLPKKLQEKNPIDDLSKCYELGVLE